MTNKRKIYAYGINWDVEQVRSGVFIASCGSPGLVLQARDMDEMLNCIHEAVDLLQSQKSEEP